MPQSVIPRWLSFAIWRTFEKRQDDRPRLILHPGRQSTFEIKCSSIAILPVGFDQDTGSIFKNLESI